MVRPHDAMTPALVFGWLDDLVRQKSPYGRSVEFAKVTFGGRDAPWKDVFQFGGPIADFTKLGGAVGERLHEGFSRIDDTYIKDADTGIFGFGSLYMFVGSDTDHVLYVGKAGNTPFQDRVAQHLFKMRAIRRIRRAADDPFPVAFSRQAMSREGPMRAAAEEVRAGRFYVAAFVYVTPWGDGTAPAFPFAFDGPHSKLNGLNRPNWVDPWVRRSLPLSQCRPFNCPFETIGTELEGWVMERATRVLKPPLNTPWNGISLQRSPWGGR